MQQNTIKYNKKRKNDSQVIYDYSGRSKTYKNGRGKTVQRSIIRIVKLWDVILVSLPFAIAWSRYYSHMVYVKDFYRKGNWLVIGLFILMYYLLSHLYSGYTIHISRISEIVYAQSLGAIVADGIMYIVMWLLFRQLPNILVLLLVFGAQLLIIIEWAHYTHKWYFKNNPPVPTVVIYDELEGVEKLVSHYGLDKRFKIVKKVSIQELQGEDWNKLSLEEKNKREKNI